MASWHAGCGALLAAAIVGPGAEGQAEEAFRIGSFLAVTGPAALLGDPQKKTLELYVERINAEGGVLGMPVELTLYDTGMHTQDAVTFVERLIEDHEVDALIGGTTTGETMAVIDRVEEAQIPFLSLAGAAVVVEPVRAWVFKTPHTDRMAIEKIYDDMRAEGAGRIGLIGGSGEFDQSCLATAERLAGDYGLEIAAEETYGPGETTVTPQLTRIRNAGVDAVLFCGFGAPSVAVTRAYAQLGMEARLYHTHGSCSKQFVEGAGAAAEGVRLPCAALVVADQLPEDDPQKAVTTAYAATYRAAYGEDVSTFGGHAYDALFLLIDAAERAGSTDPAAVRQALEQTDGFVGADGIFTLSPDDHVGLGPESFKMIEVSNGEWTLLY
jgi:branched-chain amino acid transport system substrate-binding protein